jgi:hypothetical protein
MGSSDSRYERGIRKDNLANWMISHGARTGTVTRWTGLKTHHVQRLLSLHDPVGHTQRRGAPPSQAAYFCKSSALEAESLAFIFIAMETQVIPEQILSDARRALPDLTRGERLMKAFECYRALVPAPLISLERAILLVFEYTERKTLSLRRCIRCNDVMLTETFGARHDRCPFCRKGSRRNGIDKRRE